jgi:hypothetical protein
MNPIVSHARIASANPYAAIVRLFNISGPIVQMGQKSARIEAVYPISLA